VLNSVLQSTTKKHLKMKLQSFLLKISFTKLTSHTMHVDKQNQKKLLRPYTTGQLSQSPQLLGGEVTGTSTCSLCPLWDPPFAQAANESVIKARFFRQQRDSRRETHALVAGTEVETPRPGIPKRLAEGEAAHPAGKKSLLTANGRASLTSRKWNGRIIMIG